MFRISKRRVCAATLASMLVVGAAAGCASSAKAAPNFSGYEAIAELSTLDCYYHNVAEFNRQADGGIFSLINYGYKRAWFEYTGTVRMGIDAYKVTISQPDANNVVTVGVPKARLIGEPDVDEESMSEPIVETGTFTQLTADDKTEMLSAAQQDMKETAGSDEALLAQAKTRAKDILEQYVKGVGDRIGESYTVKFVDVE